MQAPLNLSIIKTSDGSPTLFLEELNETYHSTHGAITESKFIFIDKGFMDFKERDKNISILEIGFGTGLNVLLTAIAAMKFKKDVTYISLEAYPLEYDIYSQLIFTEDENDRKLFMEIHEKTWNENHKIHDYLQLRKEHIRWEDYIPVNSEFDLVYYDAFAPSSQSEMWSKELLEKMYNSLKPGGIMVTYCAQGVFKRNLKSLGFEVESLDGPPGKAQIVRARKV